MNSGTYHQKLNKNQLAGAILDVFTSEPIPPNSELWNTPNLIITPHVSSDDGESYIKLTLELFIKNLELFIEPFFESLTIKKLKFSSKNIFSFKLNKKFKPQNVKISSEMILSELSIKNNEISLDIEITIVFLFFIK